MGCDIHMFVEYQLAPGLPWQADDHHINLEVEDWCGKCRSCKKEDYINCPHVYTRCQQVHATGRNYGLFGRLASVRGSSYRQPIGIPHDISPELAREADRIGVDGHSHSYMGLEDFKKVIYEEMDLKPTLRTDAFWHYGDPKYKDYGSRPPEYTTLITYCENLKKEKSLDKQIFGEDVTSEVQVRLVFWFDN